MTELPTKDVEEQRPNGEEDAERVENAEEVDDVEDAVGDEVEDAVGDEVEDDDEYDEEEEDAEVYFSCSLVIYEGILRCLCLQEGDDDEADEAADKSTTNKVSPIIVNVRHNADDTCFIVEFNRSLAGRCKFTDSTLVRDTRDSFHALIAQRCQ